MKKILLGIVFFTIISMVNAQSTPKVTNLTTCKKISQQLWMGKTAKTKIAQEWLIYDVSVLQKLLDRLGYFGPKPIFGSNYDLGYYDKSTFNAVKKYQETNIGWMKSTGSVGEKTLDYINKYELCNSDRRFAQLVLDKTFTVGSLSFKYPSTEFLTSLSIAENPRYLTYMDVCSVSEYADLNKQKQTLCYKGDKYGMIKGASLVVNITDAKYKETCLVPDKGVKEEDINDSVWISGLKYYKFKVTKKDTGTELLSYAYRIFKNNKCYEFRTNIESSKIGDVEDDTPYENAIDQVVGKMQASFETVMFNK